MIRIPLFDIDWTLLKGGNLAHANSFAHAFRTVYGIKGSINEIEYHGMTDQQLVLAVLEQHGISQEEALPRFDDARQAMVTYFIDHKVEGEYQALPGVIETLKRLQALSIPRGLLTGNTEPIAWRKLRAANLDIFFTFGAFGDVTDERVELIDIARRRYRTAHPELPDGELVIVGDAPRDVQCAQEGGIPAVAVASGDYSHEQLAATSPDLLLNSLEETNRLIDFLEAKHE